MGSKAAAEIAWPPILRGSAAHDCPWKTSFSQCLFDLRGQVDFDVAAAHIEENAAIVLRIDIDNAGDGVCCLFEASEPRERDSLSDETTCEFRRTNLLGFGEGLLEAPVLKVEERERDVTTAQLSRILCVHIFEQRYAMLPLAQQ